MREQQDSEEMARLEQQQQVARENERLLAERKLREQQDREEMARWKQQQRGQQQWEQREKEERERLYWERQKQEQREREERAAREAAEDLQSREREAREQEEQMQLQFERRRQDEWFEHQRRESMEQQQNQQQQMLQRLFQPAQQSQFAAEKDPRTFIKCKYGVRCGNKKCKYVHPDRPIMGGAVQGFGPAGQGQVPFGASAAFAAAGGYTSVSESSVGAIAFGAGGDYSGAGQLPASFPPSLSPPGSAMGPMSGGFAQTMQPSPLSASPTRHTQQYQQQQYQQQYQQQPLHADRIPDEYKCPITLEIMRDPVISNDGHTYGKIAALVVHHHIFSLLCVLHILF